MVEEPSMEVFLRGILPKILGNEATFEVYPFRCKDDLLTKLPQRLKGYAGWLPDDWRIVVVIDRDNERCDELKAHLENIAEDAGLLSRRASGTTHWQIATRIAIEELEAWYFGDWAAVVNVYPRVRINVARSAAYRNADAIAGGTWEHFERVLQGAGYFAGGLRKIEAAQAIAAAFVPVRNTSPSFTAFHSAIVEAVVRDGAGTEQADM